MKFKKFAKSLVPDSGVVYTRYNGERWLVSAHMMMRIPDDVINITAKSEMDMPEPIEKLIDGSVLSEPAELISASMPIADGKIKDCIRTYANQSNTLDYSISNDCWSMIDKSDHIEIAYEYVGKGETTAKGLLITTYCGNPQDIGKIAGVIY